MKAAQLSHSNSRQNANEVIIARNPKAGRGPNRDSIEDVASRLEKKGFHVHVEDDLDRIFELAAQFKSTKTLRALVCAGGDGTIRLLADKVGSEVDYAVLPLGTENLLAKHLKVRSDAEAFSQMIEDDQRIKMDAGRANGKLFLIMVSCGFDAEVVRRVHLNRSGHIRHLTYLIPLAKTIWEYYYPELKIVVDGQLLEKRPCWAFVFNVPRYAMNLPIAPQAVANDGQLDLCTFQNGNLWNGLAYFFAVLMRRHYKWRGVEKQVAKQIRIESMHSVAYQIDGDTGGDLPVSIQVLPGYLSVFVPNSL